jgi:hypothetical protein
MPGAYSGAAVRAARFDWRPPVPGVNNDHTTPDPEPDLFNPAPDLDPRARAEQGLTNPPDEPHQSNYPNLAETPVSHVYNTPPPAQFGYAYGDAQQHMQDRLVAVHAVQHYVPDTIRLYQHATEGVAINDWVGRPPREAGATVDGQMAFLANGKNGYDQTNQPNEVYVGDDANVGRYRLGRNYKYFGLYDTPTGKFGQDALLHAYTGLYPAQPFDKPPMTNTAPYTPNSTGTAHWIPAVTWQQPRIFSLPSETAVTDYSAANAGEFVSDFTDDGGFY